MRIDPRLVRRHVFRGLKNVLFHSSELGQQLPLRMLVYSRIVMLWYHALA